MLIIITSDGRFYETSDELYDEEVRGENDKGCIAWSLERTNGTFDDPVKLIESLIMYYEYVPYTREEEHIWIKQLLDKLELNEDMLVGTYN